MSEGIPRLLESYDNSFETPSVFNSKKTIEGLIIPFTLISWICVILRLWTRFRLRCLGWDDFFVVFFRVTGTIGNSFIMLMYNYGFGKHFVDLSRSDQIMVQQSYYITLLSYTVSTTLMKLCILSQYLRLFSGNPRARKVCWVFIVISALWGVAFTTIAAIPCVPVSMFWNRTSTAKCYGFGSTNPNEISGTYAAHIASNAVLDLVALAIPIPLYCRTFRLKKQRVGFTFMILVGVGINIITIWRLRNIIVTRAATYPVFDPTFYGPESIVLAAVEVDLASIVASVPVFWPMLAETWGTIFVTQEIHVTHHHRRLSGDDPFELRVAVSSSLPSSRARDESDGSMKTFIMNTEERQNSRDSIACLRDRSPTGGARHSGYDPSDPYIRGRVFPLEGGLASSNVQVVSEGQRGFERACKEHHLEMTTPLDKPEKACIRASKDRGGSMV